MPTQHRQIDIDILIFMNVQIVIPISMDMVLFYDIMQLYHAAFTFIYTAVQMKSCIEYRRLCNLYKQENIREI